METNESLICSMNMLLGFQKAIAFICSCPQLLFPIEDHLVNTQVNSCAYVGIWHC